MKRRSRFLPLVVMASAAMMVVSPTVAQAQTSSDQVIDQINDVINGQWANLLDILPNDTVQEIYELRELSS